MVNLAPIAVMLSDLMYFIVAPAIGAVLAYPAGRWLRDRVIAAVGVRHRS
jgi:hypothetical protein